LLLLAGFGVWLGITARPPLSDNLSASSVLYGALHASALVFALRARQPFWRKCLFIVAAAGLTLAALRVGMGEMQLSATLAPGMLSGYAALYAAVGFSAATGAVAYGILIRLFGMYRLTMRSLAMISLGCLLATYIALFILVHVHALGRWWLAVLWWYAFSGGLWYYDRRRPS
jgi:hypothetical protein